MKKQKKKFANSFNKFQISEILSQQWNCIFSPLDVAVFFIPVLFRTLSIKFYMSKLFRFMLKNYDSSSGVEPGSSRFVVRCSSTALGGYFQHHYKGITFLDNYFWIKFTIPKIIP